jgi:predicted Zn finger-like uncharacterized protein
MAGDALEPLITQCPTCETRFRVTDAQLGSAGGRVRCGACLTVFQAADHFVLPFEDVTLGTKEDADAALDALLAELAALASQPASDGPPTTAADAAGPAAAAPAAHSEPAARRVPVDSASTATAVDAPRARAAAATEPSAVSPATGSADTVAPDGAAPGWVAPDFSPRHEIERELADAPAAPLRAPRPLWLAGALTASLLVVAIQAFWFQFDSWSRQPALRPLYERVCTMFGCELPVLRALDAIASRNLVVRSHPGSPELLLVDAVIVNEAAFPQPFPTIELRFSSIGGQLISGQRIRPEDYLQGELLGVTTMAPNTPIRIQLEVKDPGTDAVNYVMVFR